MSFPRPTAARVAVLIACLALPAAVRGQVGAKPASALGTIKGFVYDSVHAAPLIGAVILVDGAATIGQTGPDGQFVVDSVPPGARRLHVMHPVLDTIGLSLATAE